MPCCCCWGGGGGGCGWTVSSPSSEEEEDEEDMEEDEEEQGGGEVGGHWELWFGTADWELWVRREEQSVLEQNWIVYWDLVETHLRWDLGTGGTGPVAVHPHPVLSQKLLQVHVLKLEQASITRQGPLPQHGAQESRLGVGP